MLNNFKIGDLVLYDNDEFIITKIYSNGVGLKRVRPSKLYDPGEKMDPKSENINVHKNNYDKIELLEKDNSDEDE